MDDRLKLLELCCVSAKQLLILLWKTAWSMREYRADSVSGDTGPVARNGKSPLEAERRQQCHIASVTFLVLKAAASFPCELAALVHDVVEWNPGREPALDKKLEDYGRELEGCTELRDRVKAIVSAVTEPPKVSGETLEQWWHRKRSYLCHLQNVPMDRDVWVLAISTKIHLLMEVIDVLHNGGSTPDWSKAGRDANLELFREMEEMFLGKEFIPSAHKQVFSHLLKVFQRYGR